MCFVIHYNYNLYAYACKDKNNNLKFQIFRRKITPIVFEISFGVLHFNADMPRRVEPYVRSHFIASHCKTYYYEYRNGERLISPAIQEEIRDLFREAGWNQEVHFDSYVEDYEW